MKISNQTVHNNILSTDHSIELKQGEVYSATIKERLPNNEAIIQIRGKETHVKFEDGLPQRDRVAIQVKGSKDGLPQVRTVSDLARTQDVEQELNTIIRALGVTASSELKQMAKVLIDQGQPISKETLQQLKMFLEKNVGSFSQKLETIQAIVSKGLAVNDQNLTLVHETLHSRSFSQSLSIFLKENHVNLPQVVGSTNSLSQSEIIREALQKVLRGIANEPKLETLLQLVKDRIVENPAISKDVLANVTKLINESQQLSMKGFADLAHQWLSQSLQKLLDSHNQQFSGNSMDSIIASIQTEFSNSGSIQPIVNRVRNEINIGREMPQAQGIERQLVEIENLLKRGQENRASDLLAQTLELIEVEQSMDRQVSSNLEHLIHSTQQSQDPHLFTTLADLNLPTKQYIVTEISHKMSQLAIDFKADKREVIRNLNNILHTVEQAQSQALPHVKHLIESTIDKLDRAILKSEVMLYSDMKTEKDLLVASSQLAEARRLLSKGDHQQALRILQDVKESLTKLNWQPADVKVKHLLTREITLQGPSVHNNPAKDIQEIVGRIFQPEPSARGMYEMIRALGLNHDSEVAQTLSNNVTRNDQEHLQRNMKAVMMQLLKNEQDLVSHNRQPLEQILNNLTGQQLLSKNDVGSNLQTLLFNIPYQFNDQQGDLKLYVNAKKEGEKIDWQNCSLYFLLETKKLGDTGILISAADRNLAITIKNDQAHLKERMAMIVKHHKENIQEIGYNVSGIQFTRLNEEDKPHVPIEASNRVTMLQTNMSKRGFDSKI